MSPDEVLSIEIPKEHMESLLEESRKSSEEIGALLFGKFEGKRAVVTSVKMLKYSERSSSHFLANPFFLSESLLKADEISLELVGIFHSHPAPPRPSVLDLKFMELNPVVWVIATTRRWRLKLIFWLEAP